MWRHQTYRMEKAGDPAPGAVTLEPPKEGDDAREFTAELCRVVNELQAKPGGMTKEETERVTGEVQKLAKRIEVTEKSLRDGLSTLQTAAPKRLEGLEAHMRRPAPSDIGSTSPDFYNLMQVDADGEEGRTLDGDASRFVRSYQTLADELYLEDLIRYGSGGGSYAAIPGGRSGRMKSLSRFKLFEKMTEEVKQRVGMDTATATEGTEWVPTLLSSRLQGLVQAELRIAPLFPAIAMPGKNFDLPVLGGDMVCYTVGEGTGEAGPAGALIPTSTPTTTKVSLVAKKLATRVFTSNEFVEDSIVPAIPFLTGQVAKSLARGLDDALINGDSDGTHQDSDVGASTTDRRVIFDGLRKKALISGMPNVDLATFSAANLLAIKKAMGVFGNMPSQGVWIVGFKGFIELLKLTSDGTAANQIMLTVDKMGPNATLMTGQIGTLFGSPVILSEFIREDLTSAAIYDGVTTTQTHLLYAHRESFTLGTRRQVTIRSASERHIEYDQTVFVGTWRGDFTEYYTTAAAANPIVGIGRNFA